MYSSRITNRNDVTNSSDNRRTSDLNQGVREHINDLYGSSISSHNNSILLPYLFQNIHSVESTEYVLAVASEPTMAFETQSLLDHISLNDMRHEISHNNSPSASNLFNQKRNKAHSASASKSNNQLDKPEELRKHMSERYK